MIAILTEPEQIVKTISHSEIDSVEIGLLQARVGNQKEKGGVPRFS